MEATDIVVVGAGLSGIAACKEIVRQGLFSYVCLERRSVVGGLWNFEAADQPDITFDAQDRPSLVPPPGRFPPSPMYRGLRTNVPSDLMEWSGEEPFPAGTPTFPHWDQVLQYLRDSSREIAVRYSTQVLRLRYATVDEAAAGAARWIVDIASLDGVAGRLTCQHVFLCHGHYSTPYIPRVDGLSTWKGRIHHAQYYRNAAEFDGLDVCVVGVGASGYDITRELAQRRLETGDPTRVYNSATHPPKNGWAWDEPGAPCWAGRVTAIPRIRAIDQGSFVLDVEGGTGRIFGCQAIVFASGYLYDSFFCHPTDRPWRDWPLVSSPSARAQGADMGPMRGLRVHSLDSLQLFYHDPTLALIGLHLNVVPGPLVLQQSRTVLARWAGTEFPLRPSDDESEESRAVHVLAPPRELDRMRTLVRLRGGDEKQEVPEWKYHRRANVRRLRLDVLNY